MPLSGGYNAPEAPTCPEGFTPEAALQYLINYAKANYGITVTGECFHDGPYSYRDGSGIWYYYFSVYGLSGLYVVRSNWEVHLAT